MNPDNELPADVMQQLLLSKRMMPFRIWYAAQDPRDGFWLVQCGVTKHRINALLRKGWKVVQANVEEVKS